MKTTTYINERNGNKRDFTVSKEYIKDKTPSDIMMEDGYHPAGYGQPFDITEDKEHVYFKCWNSCD